MTSRVTIFLSVLLSLSLLQTQPAAANPAADEMAQAATKFLAGLDNAQKAKAQFEFKDEERGNWHFIPKPRKGLPVKEMNDQQRTMAQALLASGLSSHGCQRATNIMSLELILQDLEGAARRFPRDPDLY